MAPMFSNKGGMMQGLCVAVVGGVLLGMAGLGPAIAADLDHGKQIYVACAGCHTEKPDAIGPSLKGVVGRKSGALEDFRYSNPMKRANLVWDEANLRDYIANPQAKVKGNRMPFGGVSNVKDLEDVIAYLKTLQ
jgi:cytochrome c